jgi:UDP-N-acetylmuramoylalanine--D-glutamate ligase
MHTLIMGAGQTGHALVKFFQLTQPKANLIIYDSRENFNNALLPKKLTSYTGSKGLEKLEHLIYNPNLTNNKNLILTEAIHINRIILSPGIHPQDKNINNLIKLCKDKEPKLIIRSEIDIFLEHANAPVIAITGTNGKSSVCRFLTLLLEKFGKKVYLGGNYGPSAISLLKKTKPNPNKNSSPDTSNLTKPYKIPNYYIIELSSFQLGQTSNFRSYISCLLNISPDHLDIHQNLNNYINAKYKIFNNCNQAIIPDPKDPSNYINIDLSAHTKSKINSNQHLELNDPLFDLRIIYNSNSNLDINPEIANLNAILKIAESLNLNLDISKKYLSETIKSGLAHRFEIISQNNLRQNLKRITWINDSKATNIGATQAALTKAKRLCETQNHNKIILIIGGDPKNQDLNLLQQFILTKNINIRALCIIGKSKKVFADLFSDHFPVYLNENILSVCKTCKAISKANDIVLLSPACSSLDEFENYQQRGNIFKKSMEIVS